MADAFASYRDWRDSVELAPLPLEEVGFNETGDHGKQKRKAGKVRVPPSIRYARCPRHQISGKSWDTGVIKARDGREVFRPHTKRVGSATMPCPGSGEEAPPA